MAHHKSIPPPAPKPTLPPPPPAPLRHLLRRHGSVAVLALGLLSASGALTANLSRTTEEMRRGRAGWYWSGVALSQVFGIAAVALGRRAVAQVAEGDGGGGRSRAGVCGGFAGFNAFFSG